MTSEISNRDAELWAIIPEVEGRLNGLKIRRILEGERRRLHCRLIPKSVCGIEYMGVRNFFTENYNEIRPQTRFLVGRLVPALFCGSLLTVGLTILVATGVLKMDSYSPGILMIVSCFISFPIVMSVLYEIPGCGCLPSHYIYERSLAQRLEQRSFIITKFLNTLDDASYVDPKSLARLIASMHWGICTESSLMQEASVREFKVMLQVFKEIGMHEIELCPAQAAVRSLIENLPKDAQVRAELLRKADPALRSEDDYAQLGAFPQAEVRIDIIDISEDPDK